MATRPRKRWRPSTCPTIKAIRGADHGGGGDLPGHDPAARPSPPKGGGPGQGLGLEPRPRTSSLSGYDVIMAGGLTSGQRGRGARRTWASSALGRRCGDRRRGRRLPQGSERRCGLRRSRALQRRTSKRIGDDGSRTDLKSEADARGHVRPVWGPLRARDADQRRWTSSSRRPRISAAPEFRRSSTICSRTTPDGPRRSLLPARMTEDTRRREDLPEARGSGAHRRPQDQQRARAGAAGPSHGQAARDRRDGRGQHGVATATACALLGLECEVYMGAEDVRAAGAQRLSNGAPRGRVSVPVESGSRDAQGRHQRGDARLGHERRDTYYCIGSVMGPHPYPTLVRDFQRVIGVETREQILGGGGASARRAGGLRGRRLERDGPLPSVHRGRGRSPDRGRAAGKGGLHSGRHGARSDAGAAGILHGMRTCVLSDDDGQIFPGALDLGRTRLPGRRARARLSARRAGAPSTCPRPTRRRSMPSVYLSQTEGIIPALESAHAIAHARKLAPTLIRRTQIDDHQPLGARRQGRGRGARDLLAARGKARARATRMGRIESAFGALRERGETAR